MITPSDRLLFWVAMLIPLAAAGGLVPGMAAISVGLFIALLSLAALDAATAQKVWQGVAVSLPEVVRLSKDKPGGIPVRIQNAAMKELRLRVGLPLPPEIRSEQDEFSVLAPGGNSSSGFVWPCVADRRGRFAIGACYFEALSPLGFWNSRSSAPCKSEVRVYPNLMADRRRLAAIFLNRGNFGAHAQRMVGQGREFEKLREYAPGDGYEDIHWKATAKRNRPVTKLFQNERVQEIYVLVDSSRLSARETGGEPALERALRAALTLGLVAERQSDLFGIAVFSDKVKRFVRASSGKAHYSACRDAIYAMHSELVAPDFGELGSFVRLRLRRRALLMILTDLSDSLLAEGFLRNVELFCRQHLVLVTMARPAGAAQLFSTPDADSTDSLYGKLGGHIVWRNLKELQKSLGRRGVGFATPDHDRLTADLVAQYMSVKARQRL